MAKRATAPRAKAPCDNFFDHSRTARDFAIDIHHKFDEKSKDFSDFISSLEVLAAILKLDANTFKDLYYQYKSGSAAGFFAFNHLMRGYDDAHIACKGTPSGFFAEPAEATP